MKPGAALAAGAVVVGFALGFLWGKGTREATASNLKTDFSGGVLRVELDAGQSISDGLTSYFK